jgi:hypothetical protein
MAASPRLDLPGSSLEAEFGGTGGGVRPSPVLEATGAQVGTYTAGAPAKATAAPKGSTKEVFTGLAEALNTYQKRLVKEGKYTVADEYEFEFAPPAIGASKLKKPGGTDYKKTGMQDNKTAADQKDMSKVNTNMNSRQMQVSAGMQIVQFIDQVMRNSEYITDQQTVQVDDTTQKTVTNKNPATGQVAWYKVSVQATQLEYDPKRNDHAYRMKFVITPYAINTMQSNFFPDSRFRGTHKRYNYWFTGNNTEILNFEQEYNNLYRLIISGIGPQLNKPRPTSDFRNRDKYRKIALPTSENAAKGADGYTNEPGDNAADFLYSPTDQAKVKLRIVGDPAWMQQGEIASGVNSKTFNFNPFNADGGINFDSQEVVFDISFNRPVDYDFNTGIMDVNARNTQAGEPQENLTYTAIKCKNFFSRGRFEQELEGRLLIEFDQGNQQTAVNRPVSGDADAQEGGFYGNTRSSGTRSPGEGDWVDVDGLQVLSTEVPEPALPDSAENLTPEPLLLNLPTSDAAIEPRPIIANDVAVADINSTVTQNGNREA